ncbi:TetR/AcrR family transcriptional regulator [Novosphingobium lentum]|uniref:TetR/AcrR family transcriptional regulator n=1 Tax=Novosphingobium lentum TaxID=145287 RepID=UPI0008313C72|nr:TetR family transcriptional regulator [Novosphingobium lentum]
MRKDAARNRERLIAVAREYFRAGVADVSLEEIAVKAGVGRSTLFRNFADRLDLIRAVQAAEQHVIAEECRRLGDRPDALFGLMRTVARLTFIYRAMDDSLLASPAGKAMMLQVSRETAATFAEPIARARAAGLLRADVALEDILIACTMIGAAQGGDFSTSDAIFDRAFALILRGIGAVDGGAAA